MFGSLRDTVASLLTQLTPTQSPSALFDVAIVAVIIYYTYLLIRETRAIRILYGLALLGLVFVIAQWLQLLALLFLLRSIFAVILVAIPVVFQPELRAALERLGRTRLTAMSPVITGNERNEVVHILSETVMLLAAKKVGALIVIEQHDSLREIASTGVSVHAYLSTELLASIFMNRSPLHDGAVLIHGTRLETASALLPAAGGRFDTSIGTRHRAAVGVTTETDAIALVVSEETGKISLAQDGQLVRNLRPASVELSLMTALTRSDKSLVSPLIQRISKRSRRA